jgi:thiol-disulfide isomerase/thioredoxin
VVVVDFGFATMDATLLSAILSFSRNALEFTFMKHLILSAALAIPTLLASAQFGTAPDFNVTDIDGNQHQLYADILDQGLIAVVDVSATWCGPCWSLHDSHALQDLHEAYGPDGTNQLRVIFYEADGGTTMADLEGITGSTQGNWLDGVTYPIVNESPVTLNMNIWAPLGFPTVNVIRPSDYEIVLDTWNLLSFDEQVDAINGANIDGIELGVVSTNDLSNVARDLTVFPNPSNGQFALSMEGFIGAVTVDVYNIVGRKVWTSIVNAQAGIQQVNLTSLDAGNYLISASDDAQTLTRRLTLLD